MPLSESQEKCLAGLLLGGIYFLVVSALVTGLYFLCTYEPPIYKPIFLIESALVDPFNISDSHLTANWNVSIILRTEDNSHPLFFEYVRVFVLLKNVVVSSKAVDPFYFKGMTKSEEKKFQVNLASANYSGHMAINQSVVEAVNGERINNGSLTFSFNLTCLGTLNRRYMYYDPTPKHMVVSCEDLKLNFGSNSNTSSAISTGEPFECNNVRLYD